MWAYMKENSSIVLELVLGQGFSITFCGGPWRAKESLKVDMPILTCIFFTFNWLTLTSEMYFVKFHPEVTSCLLSRGKRKYAPLGMRLLWKIHKKLFSGILFNFTLFVISPKLQRIWNWNFGFAIRKIWTFIWYQKMYYFRLSPGGWECNQHKGPLKTDAQG